MAEDELPPLVPRPVWFLLALAAALAVAYWVAQYRAKPQAELVVAFLEEVKAESPAAAERAEGDALCAGDLRLRARRLPAHDRYGPSQQLGRDQRKSGKGSSSSTRNSSSPLSSALVFGWNGRILDKPQKEIPRAR